jgi:hypothetical protein
MLRHMHKPAQMQLSCPGGGPAFMAESFHLDFNMIRPVAHRPLQLSPHPVESHRFQALDFPAGLALEVGVGRVVLAGQFKVVDPALQGELAHHAPPVKILQDAVHRDLVHPAALVAESADVLYHLLVMWVNAGIRPEAVWNELQRREGISGIAEKASRVRKLPVRLGMQTTKIP